MKEYTFQGAVADKREKDGKKIIEDRSEEPEYTHT